MDEPALQIVEQDGDVVRVVGAGIEIIAQLYRSGDEIIVEGLSIDGAGPRTLGLARMRQLARRFLRDNDARRLRIRGTTRTKGSNPGRSPREIVIDI
jgi:hypothetical protein